MRVKALFVPLAGLLIAAAPPPRFDALRFFSGATAGSGRLKILLRAGREIRVHGRGTIRADGVLVLEQDVAQDQKPPTHRTWQIREVAPGRYAGTLTDATGAVGGQSIGDRLHLWYRAKGGIRIDQWLLLASDGRSAQNLLTARKWGIPVARVHETIRKMD